jgi:hypothetical protein
MVTVVKNPTNEIRSATTKESLSEVRAVTSAMSISSEIRESHDTESAGEMDALTDESRGTDEVKSVPRLHRVL